MPSRGETNFPRGAITSLIVFVVTLFSFFLLADENERSTPRDSRRTTRERERESKKGEEILRSERNGVPGDGLSPGISLKCRGLSIIRGQPLLHRASRSELATKVRKETKREWRTTGGEGPTSQTAKTSTLFLPLSLSGPSLSFSRFSSFLLSFRSFSVSSNAREKSRPCPRKYVIFKVRHAIPRRSTVKERSWELAEELGILRYRVDCNFRTVGTRKMIRVRFVAKFSLQEFLLCSSSCILFVLTQSSISPFWYDLREIYIPCKTTTASSIEVIIKILITFQLTQKYNTRAKSLFAQTSCD